MKTRRGTAAYAALVAACASALTPTAALAEESVSGADILIPKVGEFVPALIAFLVVFFVLSKFAWPSILAMMEKRESTIAQDLDEAEQAKVKAAEQLQAYEAKMAGAQRDADAIIAQAKVDAEASATRIVEDARTQASDIVTRGRKTVESERRAAVMDLTDSIADISVGAASKILDKNLDTEAQRRLVRRYLDEVGGFDAR